MGWQPSHSIFDSSYNPKESIFDEFGMRLGKKLSGDGHQDKESPHGEEVRVDGWVQKTALYQNLFVSHVRPKVHIMYNYNYLLHVQNISNVHI